MIWKQLFDTNQISPTVARILQRLRLSPKKLTILSRIMIDYIIVTCPQPGAPSNPKFVAVVTHLNDLIWKYFFCPLDRLLLCIVSYMYMYSVSFLYILYSVSFRCTRILLAFVVHVFYYLYANLNLVLKLHVQTFFMYMCAK